MRLCGSRLRVKDVVGYCAVAVSVVALSGCHSHYVSMDVRNETGKAVTLVEVDYPSASFGKESLAEGADFHYRFKVQGDGPLKAMWTDAGNHDHSVAGPQLQ